MFPGPHAHVYYNEAGEPLGWDNVVEYGPDPGDPYDDYDDRWFDYDERDDDSEKEDDKVTFAEFMNTVAREFPNAQVEEVQGQIVIYTNLCVDENEMIVLWEDDNE